MTSHPMRWMLERLWLDAEESRAEGERVLLNMRPDTTVEAATIQWACAVTKLTEREMLLPMKRAVLPLRNARQLLFTTMRSAALTLRQIEVRCGVGEEVILNYVLHRPAPQHYEMQIALARVVGAAIARRRAAFRNGDAGPPPSIDMPPPPPRKEPKAKPKPAPEPQTYVPSNHEFRVRAPSPAAMRDLAAAMMREAEHGRNTQ